MCTVSVRADSSSFLVTMNRDERRSRIEAEPFVDLDCLYPVDKVSGGTWCGVNRFGIAFCLLNRYDAPLSTDPNILSRGDLIPKALQANSVSAASDVISSIDHSAYNGFRLLMISRTESCVNEWDRSTFSVKAVLARYQRFI